ncbi:MAG: hypothetical protein AB7E55_14690 [Pigmentiphaga sp.]
MIEGKRSRGRPKGASPRYKAGDAELLGKVADRLHEEPALPFTTAARRVLGGKGAESHIRRLQRRWKEEGPAYLASAKERAARRREVRVNGSLGRLTAADAAVLMGGRTLQALDNERAMAAAKKIAALGSSLNKVLVSDEVLMAAKRLQAIHESLQKAVESPGMAKFVAQAAALQDRVNQWATPTRLEQLARSVTLWDENMRRILAPTRAEEIARSAVLAHRAIYGALPPKDR